MKRIFMLCLLISSTGFAQKNIVAVPLAEVVDKKNVLIQPSITANENLLQIGNILTFGLGSNWQAGVTLTDITFNFGSETNFFPVEKVKPGVNPELLVNLQKGFRINQNTWIAIGTLTGANIAKEGTNLSMFSYVNGQTHIFGKNVILLGVYHGEETYLVTDEKKLGIMAGIEVPISDKWTFLGDFISGDNARSYINTGLEVKLNDEWSLMGGAGFPAPDSGNKTIGIIQLSYLGK